MMSEEVETTTPEYWLKRWEDNQIGWHKDTVNRFLIKYADELTQGRSSLRVFVPLCGKSLDMLWLADQGHNVVGVELAKQGIEEFFNENKLTFKLEKVKIASATLTDPIDVYKCVERQITIFCCDLFTLTAEDLGGEFDAIWDRGSLSAVQPGVGDRGKRYAKHMRSFLAANGRYMLDSLHYEIDRGNRPPASISKELRNDIYGEDFFIKELKVDSIGNDPNSPAPFTMDNYCHLFKPKAN